jgi:hypothetical protein
MFMINTRIQPAGLNVINKPHPCQKQKYGAKGRSQKHWFRFSEKLFRNYHRNQTSADDCVRDRVSEWVWMSLLTHRTLTEDLWFGVAQTQTLLKTMNTVNFYSSCKWYEIPTYIMFLLMWGIIDLVCIPFWSS